MRRTIKTIITLFLVLLIFSIAGFLFYLRWIIYTPAVKGSDQYQIFEVKKGESTFLIAQRLKSKNLIASDWVFFLNAKFKSKPLVTGYYNLSPNMTMLDIFNKVSSGDTNIVKITIPEGYRAEQIAQVFDDKKITNYSSFVEAAKKHEGKLFPDTYFFPTGMSDIDIIKAMTANYEERTKDLQISDEDLIVASIVEREASKDEERPLIAGIYKNRIAIKMKLEADPTVQYGRDNLEIKNLDSEGKKQFKFWKPITSADYQTVDSPYNTYLISGLPPSPICNPGIKSIEGAINYSKHKYLYFLQNGGKIYPSETLEGHNKNRRDILGVKK
ncbi:MAG: endolytic transglycosylase MltG [Patescibacteria group bacterium]|nr:endolytic transglycosylase MltG [Patescibacteria group bacterium]